MRNILSAVAILCFAASLVMAQSYSKDAVSAPSEAAATLTAEMTLKGDIVDNMCGSAQKPEALSEFVRTHTKECATMPACEASGYSLVVDGKLMKLDNGSSAMVAEFLKKPESKLSVVVEARKVGEELSLLSIKNQE